MLGVLARWLLPGVKISSYTARHTWATLAYHMDMPVGIICQALGHSSVRVTETYLKPFENERVDKANRKLISTVRKGKWGALNLLMTGAVRIGNPMFKENTLNCFGNLKIINGL